MHNTLEYIHKMILEVVDIDAIEWANYSAMFEIKEFKKKEVILNVNSICQNVYFVNSGLLRTYFTDKNGRESTFHFAQEFDLATDLESFIQQTPSKYHIQALEETQVVVWPHKMVFDGYKNLRNGEKLGRMLTEKYFILFSNKIQSLYTKTPLERYNEMNKRFPTILQRVPQHYIASYLNITSVHLSRLKNE